MSSWLSVVIQVRDLTRLRVMSNWLSVVVQVHDLALRIMCQVGLVYSSGSLLNPIKTSCQIG